MRTVDDVFPTPIKYLETGNPTYDPATGQTTPNVTEHSINAGILSRGRSEFERVRTLDHHAGGLASLAKASDPTSLLEGCKDRSLVQQR